MRGPSDRGFDDGLGTELLDDLERCRDCGEELHTDAEYQAHRCGSCVDRRLRRFARAEALRNYIFDELVTAARKAANAGRAASPAGVDR